MKPLRFPFYPFVLFILFPIQYFAANIGIFDETNVIRLLAFLLAVCGVLFWILWLVTRRRDLAAYVMAMLPIIGFNFLPVPVFIIGLCATAALIGYVIHRIGLTRPLVKG